MLPTFLVIGAMKAGTTSLAEYLRAHPQVFVTRDKEPNFFSRPERQALGLEWYASLFADAGAAVARGEASTEYTKFPRVSGAPKRIAEVVPDVRLVYVVRHPIERIRSQYLHQVLRGQEKRPLTQALQEGPEYINTSRYGLQLDRYLEHFARDQIMVVTSDQLRECRGETMARVYRFVGVDPNVRAEQLKQEFGVTASRGPVRPFERRLQAVPGRRLAARVAPSVLKSMYHRIATRRMDDVAELAALPPDVVRGLTVELKNEVARLRDFLGEDFDGWGIA